MISFLIGLGLSARAAGFAARIVLPIAGVLILLVTLYFAIDAHGDSRFREGRAVENAVWQEAQDILILKAAAASTAANTEDLARQIDHAAQVEQEKDKLNEAIANGTSRFDALFPTE